MGNVRITASGIQVQGEAEFLNAIYTESITTHRSSLQIPVTILLFPHN